MTMTRRSPAPAAGGAGRRPGDDRRGPGGVDSISAGTGSICMTDQQGAGPLGV